MAEIVLPINEKRSPREDASANRLLVAAMFGQHEEVARLLQTPVIKRMIKRGALQFNEGN